MKVQFKNHENGQYYENLNGVIVYRYQVRLVKQITNIIFHISFLKYLQSKRRIRSFPYLFFSPSMRYSASGFLRKSATESIAVCCRKIITCTSKNGKRKVGQLEAESKEKHGVYDPVDYNLILSRLQSRLHHIYLGQPYGRVDLNPLPDSTLSSSYGT